MTIAPRTLIGPCLAAALLVSMARAAAVAETVVQIPVGSLIDGRSVSTVAGGTVTPWTPGLGVDGNGGGDGFVTNAVEAILATQGKTTNGQVGVALPNDGMFAADARHPAVVLHFSNTDPIASPQTHQVYQAKGAQSFQVAIPAATYSKMFLFITCSEGAAALTITLNYAGGTPMVTKLTLPDYGIGGASANDPVFFNLISRMRKWTTTDMETDTTSHTITGIELNPTATATLTSIDVAKTNQAHVVFWGATGIATSAVAIGADGGGTDGGAGGASDGGSDDGRGGGGGAGGAGGGGGVGDAAATGGTGGSPTGAGGTAGGSTASGPAGSGANAAGAAGTGASAAGAAGTAPKTSGGSSGCSVSGSAPPGGASGRALLGMGLGFALGVGLIFGALVFRPRRRA
jgi:hypothetical protein